MRRLLDVKSDSVRFAIVLGLLLHELRGGWELVLVLVLGFELLGLLMLLLGALFRVVEAHEVLEELAFVGHEQF